MKKPWRVCPVYLAASAAFLLLAVVLMLNTRETVANDYLEIQLKAAERMAAAEAYLKEALIERGIEIEPEDLNKTGLLGPEFTELTSTPGNPDAKRTSLTPDFAALMIKWYMESDLKEGDVIAIGTSGSFPGLLIASLCAATEMKLDVRVLASLGASMHGATRPDFNILDILTLLKEGGYAEFEVLAVSPGGRNDQGGGVFEGILYEGSGALSLKLCRESGYPVIFFDDLAENIQYRLSLLGEDVALFINVGGASVNNGTSAYTLDFPQGLVTDPPPIPVTPYRGLCYEFASRGVPVLNLLNVKKLAAENGIPYDPVPFPQIGKSGVYYSVRYLKAIALGALIIALALLVIGVVRSPSSNIFFKEVREARWKRCTKGNSKNAK